MKSTILSFALIIASLFVLGGCQSAEEAEVVADQFHEQLKQRNYGRMMKMIDKEAFAISKKDDWEKIFRSMEELGELKTVKKDIGFNSQMSNGITTVELKYTLTFEKGTLNEQIIFIKKNDGFKLCGYNIIPRDF